MVKHIFRLSILLSLIFVSSCAKESLETVGTLREVVISAENRPHTKTVYDSGANYAKWSPKEIIGVAATWDGTFTDALLQRFEGINENESRATDFHGVLTDKGLGEYKLYGVYPYRQGTRLNDITYTLKYLQNPDAGNWDPACDFMVGSSVAQTEDDVTGIDSPITFNHIMGWVKVSFAGFTACATEKVEYVRIAGNRAMAGDFTIDILTGSIDTDEADDTFIFADFSDDNINLQDLGAYITMFPGEYDYVDMSVKTAGHFITCRRYGLTVTANTVNSVTVNNGNDTQCSDAYKDCVSVSQAKLCGAMPAMNSRTVGELNVLLLGHSFGLDCTEYVPNLLVADGITNVSMNRIYYPDCSLEDYRNFLYGNGKHQYFESFSNGKWAHYPDCSTAEAIASKKWDVVVFQQSTAGSGRAGTFKGSGDYSSFQPYLAFLMDFIVCVQMSEYSNIPYMCWNNIQSYNSNRVTDMDLDYTTMYNAMVSAVGQMKTESGITRVIDCGGAMQAARQTFTDSKYCLLLRDGWHASLGLGRYVEACTWFEQLFKPIYANGGVEISVVGNTFRPNICSSDSDIVDNDKALVLQNIAANLATL